MDFSRGTPSEDGKYIAYVKDFSSPGWLKPIVLVWVEGHWRYVETLARYWEPVFLWNGPLPCGKLDDFVLAKMDFEL